MISATSSSVSRQAVPLPIATTPTSCLPTRSLRWILGLGPPVLGRVRVNHRLVDQVAAPVEHGHLAAGPEPGVDGQDNCLGIGGCKSKPAEVLGKDLDGVLLGCLGQIAANLALHAGEDQSIEGVDRGPAEKLGLGMTVQRKLS